MAPQRRNSPPVGPPGGQATAWVHPAATFHVAGRDAFREKAEREALRKAELAARRKAGKTPIRPVQPAVGPTKARPVSAAIIPWPASQRVVGAVAGSTKISTPAASATATVRPAASRNDSRDDKGKAGKAGGGHGDGPFNQDDVAGVMIVLLMLVLGGWMTLNLSGHRPTEQPAAQQQIAVNPPAAPAPVEKPDPFPPGPVDLRPRSPVPDVSPPVSAPPAAAPGVAAQAVRSPPTSAPTPVGRTCAPDRMIHAYFCTSRSVLTASARKALDAEISSWRRCAADQEVTVRGYADTRGASKANVVLGKERAAALAAILRDRGMNVVEVAGVGELDGLDDEQNCANQRRVDIGLKSEIAKTAPSRACAPPAEAVPIACESRPSASDPSPGRAR